MDPITKDLFKCLLGVMVRLNKITAPLNKFIDLNNKSFMTYKYILGLLVTLLLLVVCELGFIVHMQSTINSLDNKVTIIVEGTKCK